MIVTLREQNLQKLPLTTRVQMAIRSVRNAGRRGIVIDEVDTGHGTIKLQGFAPSNQDCRLLKQAISRTVPGSTIDLTGVKVI